MFANNLSEYVSLLKATLAMTTALLVYVIATAIYNLYFHPLARFPGPWLARVSPVYGFIHAYKADTHLDIARCHQIYGDVVRYHPNRILFSSASAMKTIYRNTKSMKKSDGYSPHPYYPGIPNLFSCTDKDLAIWKKKFMTRALTECLDFADDFVLARSCTLNQLLLQSKPDLCADKDNCQWGPPCDMSELTYFYALDCLWGLIFGRTLRLMTSDTNRWLLKAFTEGNSYMYMQLAWPTFLKSRLAYWANPARFIYPDMTQDGDRFDRLAASCRTERESMANMKGKDITASLEAALDPRSGLPMDADERWTELFMLVRAGGDTTSTAFAATLFYLSRHRDAYDKLAHEIRTTFPTLALIRRGQLLQSCRYLRACIDESMRLAPPAPGSFWRQVTDDGFYLEGEAIPKGYEVGTGLYALFHNAQYFPNPWQFKPERFLHIDHDIDTSSRSKEAALSKGDSDRSAFVPFLMGPRRCPAQELAYMQILVGLARMMWEMDFKVAGDLGQGGKTQGWGRERKDEFQLRDIFAADKQGPLLTFKRRSQTDECNIPA